MDVKIVPYKAVDLIGMPIRDVAGKAAEIAHSEKYLSWLEAAGHGYSLFVDGEIIGSIVFVQNGHPDTVEAMGLISPRISKYYKLVHRICKTALAGFVAGPGFKRIQCRVDEQSKRNRRWIEALGFVPGERVYSPIDYMMPQILYSRAVG